LTASRKVSIAAIDSGINPNHPHVGPVAGGVSITAEGTDPSFLDLLGHGTAVAGAIREKAPGADLFAVKVFDRVLSTSGAILLRALDWCIEREMDFINLSLGTSNAAYQSLFEDRVQRARSLGLTIVAAYEVNGRPALPGALEGVVGVLLEPACPRDRLYRVDRAGRTLLAASGYPRAIPGVPQERNLQGISFAVANVTGLLAAGWQDCTQR